MTDYSGEWQPGPSDPQGLLGLPAACDLADVEPALRRWVAGLNGADSLKLLALREQVYQELKARGVTSAKKMVDAALDGRPSAPKTERTEATADQRGAARDAGREMLNHPRPLELLEDSLRGMGLGGSLVIPKTVFLAATTRLLSATLSAHLHILGPASSGKSYEADAALEHLPEDVVIPFDGGSPRSLIYYDEEICHRVLLYSEMDALPIGGDDGDASNVALTYLRTLCSKGRARYPVVQKNKDGGMTTVVYEREGPAVVIVTGTKPIPDDQLRSRLHEVEVRVDRPRLQAVLNAQGSSLAGRKGARVNPAIVAAQEYLQSLAPVDVHVPFAPELARRLFERVRMADPRLSRELSRVSGFTAAHALLCIERRRRGPDGAVVAELEDYAAARDVVRELSTTREYSGVAIEVWEAVDAIHKATSGSVTMSELKKKVMKDRRTLGRAVRELLDGGALEDHREAKASRTAPYILTSTGDRPGQTPLPTVEELSTLPPAPPESAPKPDQVYTAQEASLGTPQCQSKPQVLTAQGDTFGAKAPPFGAKGSSMTGKDLTPLGRIGGGGKAGTPPPNGPAEGYRFQGLVYHQDDLLPDGRRVTFERGIPILIRPAADPTACPCCGRDSCEGDCGVGA